MATPDQRYTMRRLLGRGGMGEIWLAHDARINRDVAIKLMRSGTEEVDRFLREARVQGRLEHPCIVPVHDIGDGDAPYFVMKRLAGTTLADAIARNAEPWTRRTLLARFVDVCLAIEFAHQRGVIHRDLKPANIMLGDFGETYVLDWGLARVAGAAAEPATLHTGDLRVGETVAGSVLGTPGYMAPEQSRGELVDHRADLYALGCVLFEILTGMPAVARKHALEPLSVPCHRPSLQSPDVAPELDQLCAYATAADPAARLASARELANGVQRFLDGDRDLARRLELAAEHAARANELLENVGDSARSEAMREAGRALALDSSNRAAQQVLSRLLIEPPREIPAAARSKLERERRVALHAVARVSVISYPLFLLLLASLVAFGVPLSPPILVVFGLLVVLSALSLRFANPRRPIPGWLVPIAGTLHVALIAVTGMIFGTLLILPMMAFGSLPAFLLLPAGRASSVVMAAHALGLAVPLALEVTGAVPRSYQFVGDSIQLRPWAIRVEPTTLLVGVLAIIVIQLVANYVILGRLRRAQDRAQEQLHVQSWQLEQLVVETEPPQTSS